MKIRIGAYAQIIQSDRIFLTRKKGGPYKGLWDLPGGGVEFGETPLQALHRELLEEAAFTAVDPTLLTVLSQCGEYLGAPYHYIGVIYRVDAVVSTSHIPEEEGMWFPLVSLPPVTPFVDQLRTHNYFI